jgi:hypothetical protein
MCAVCGACRQNIVRPCAYALLYQRRKETPPKSVQPEPEPQPQPQPELEPEPEGSVDEVSGIMSGITDRHGLELD